MSDKAAIIKEAQKFLARGQIDKAIAEWEKLIKESPDGNTYNIIGDLYLKKGDKTPAVDSFHKAARLFRDEGFSLKALALYKKILNIEPLNPEAMIALGELSEEKGLATEAIKYYLASADILAKEGKKDALLKTYDRILNLSPANIPLRNKVAELFMKEGLQIEAAKEYLHGFDKPVSTADIVNGLKQGGKVTTYKTLYPIMRRDKTKMLKRTRQGLWYLK